jgi:hypothetical protein
MFRRRAVLGGIAVVVIAISTRWGSAVEVTEACPECLVTTETWVWGRYEDQRTARARAGQSVDSKDMRDVADADRAATWDYKSPASRDALIRFLKKRGLRDGIAGAENSGWGVSGDIQAWTNHDFTVLHRYGWRVDPQPRGEVVDTFDYTYDREGTIVLENRISFSGAGYLSGTLDEAGEKKDIWPQENVQNATLHAVDINGAAHAIRIAANNNVVPTVSQGESKDTYDESNWEVSGGVEISKEGVGGGLGGSVGGSKTVQVGTSSGREIPAIADQVWTVDASNDVKVERTVELGCNEEMKVSRAAQVTLYAFAKGHKGGANVRNQGAYAVSNRLSAKISCVPCEHKNPGTKPPEHVPPYGTAEPGSYDPQKKGGKVITPHQGDVVAPGAHFAGKWTDDPRWKYGGCIYLPPGWHGDTLETDGVDRIRRSDAANPDHQVPPGRIPLVVPDDEGSYSHVAYARLPEDTMLIALGETRIAVLPVLQRLVFDGPFEAFDPGSGESQVFGAGAYIDFAHSGMPHLVGPVHFAAPAGERLEYRLEGERLMVATVDEESGLQTGAVVVDESEGMRLIFERALSWPTAPDPAPRAATVDAKPAPAPCETCSLSRSDHTSATSFSARPSGVRR